ncbi:MAG: Mov34/MPN/PAD-1 family protein [Deltaproteobacteria bacterium]|nr:Mov34/MPN/PAD-1 family protein [Deltaproteobacteria bacterium]
MSGDTPTRPVPIRIPQEVLTEVYSHARREFPAECCGWLVGPHGEERVDRARPCRNAHGDGGHPTAPSRTAETAYVIAGDDLLELCRTLDGPEPPRIIYHSHPNGRAYFSETDQAVATDPWGEGPMYPVQQLVVGLNHERIVEAKLFAWDKDAGAYVEVACFPGMTT